jgi:tRNA modification GTPase
VLRSLSSGGEQLDRAIVLWLPGPYTQTGQDMAELHVHGGRAVVEAVSAALIKAGARPAEPGEFSRRAFLAGRMDLLEAEAIADLIAADTQAQRRQALRQMDGAQSALLAAWRARMMRFLAFQESLIDFSDEDLPGEVESEMLSGLAALQAELSTHLSQSRIGMRLREGLLFALIGAPNVGKSSLLNALAKRDVAIVSPTPGTTRDVIEVSVDLGGIAVTLVDTAGLRTSDDPVELEGVRRGKARARTADLIIAVHAPDGPAAALEDTPIETLLVANKCDIAPPPTGMLAVSAKTGGGLEALEAALSAQARRLTEGTEAPVLNRARHVSALAEATEALALALSAPLPELRAEDLRMAMRALGRITGEVDAETILDVVFGSFCIGK